VASLLQSTTTTFTFEHPQCQCLQDYYSIKYQCSYLARSIMFCVHAAVHTLHHTNLIIHVGNTCIHELDYRYIFIYLLQISTYIKVNSNRLNYCRPNEHNPEKSATQEWQHNPVETRINLSLGIHIYILSRLQLCWNSQLSCSNSGMLTAISYHITHEMQDGNLPYRTDLL